MQSIGCLGLEPKINKQIVGLEGVEYHKRNAGAVRMEKTEERISTWNLLTSYFYQSLGTILLSSKKLVHSLSIQELSWLERKGESAVSDNNK